MLKCRVIFYLFLLFPVICAFSYPHPGGMHTKEQIEFVKGKILHKDKTYHDAYLQLLSFADAALTRTSYNALKDFNVPGYYIDPELHKANSKGLQTDAFDAYACALAYQLSGKEQYAEKSLDILMAWADKNTKYSNYDGSLVMAYSGTAMIIAGDLLYNYDRWKKEDKENYLSWVRNVYRKSANEIRNRTNNWADWGRLGSILSAHLLDDKEEVKENIHLIKSDLFHKIAPDGHMPEEVRRKGNGIWYTYFSLAPVTAASWVALQTEGEDIFSMEKDGSSIKKALDYLLYYSQHPGQWKWFENPRPGSPDSWPGNLLEAMHGIYGEGKYDSYVKNTRPHAYPTHHFAWTFPSLMKPLRSFEEAGDNDQDLLTIRERVVSELLAPAIDGDEIQMLMTTSRKDGSWPGIDYEDVSNTGFQHSRHLSNMVELSRAYKVKGSGYYKDQKLKETIYSALDFWLNHDFICDNWWWNQIGTPDRIVNVLLIMDEDLTAEQKIKAAPIAGRANLNAWGARPGGDLIKIAAILGKYSLFINDDQTLEEVVKTMASEITFAVDRGDPSDVRGLQTDLSFHHRKDRVTSTLSYGLGYAGAFADWAAKVAGTKYSFPDKAIELLVDFYLDGICRSMIYGKYPDPGAKNRSITRQGALNPAGTEIPEKLMQATGYRSDELANIVAIRRGEVKPELEGNKFFWHTEYLSHQRPHYFTSVRMFSSRNHTMEVPYNGEGIKNHHLGDGANFISRTGEEYTDIFPVWDWQKIPGTTVVQKEILPDEREIQKKGITGFVGAVTDGKFGAATFDFESPVDLLQARKAWFMFDKEYVSLGSGITSKAPFPVATTLNQCYLKPDVVIGRGKRKSALKKGDHHLKRISWILHDSIGYFFPEPTDLHLQNQEAVGSWYSINRQSDSPKEEVRKDVFKLWMDHGRLPEQKTYAYIVIPGTGVDEIVDYQKNAPVEILSNTTALQAVKHNGLGLTQMVFYEAGELRWNGMNLEVKTPGVVMVYADGRQIKKITVADPSRELKTLQLKVNSNIDGSGDNFKAVWHEEGGYSDIIIDLPQQEYAGKSVSIEIEPGLIGENNLPRE